MNIWRTDDAWWGDDKLTHGFGAYALALTLAVALHVEPWLGATIALLAGVLVEVVELVRFLAGVPLTAGLVDRVSLKDLTWDTAGALVAFWVALLAR